jgi:hypothetical protein
LTIKKNLDDRQDVPELIQNLLDAKEALMNQKT